MASICDGGSPLILGGSDGVIFPLVHIESQVLGGILYFIGLMWCFQGVGIIADIFMSAIEKITSAKKQVRVTDSAPPWDDTGTTPDKNGDEVAKSEPRMKTVKVWNDTVANLTLMALGSSAPEILLSVIELAPNKMKSGALGPSTIVGSAAFNLLIITAVCISALPEGESRRIKDISVFAVTASFSIFAYLWLIVILMMWTPDVVTPVESLLTVIFLPVLVVLAYLADIGLFHKVVGKVKGKRLIFSHDTTPEDYSIMMEHMKKTYPKMPDTQEAVNLLLRYEFPEKTTRAVRRMEATRGMSGQHKQVKDRHLHTLGENVSKELKPPSCRSGSITTDSVVPFGDGGEPDHKPNAIFEHVSEMYAVFEKDGKVLVTVRRRGNEHTSASCKFRTIDGTAKRDEDYVHKQGRLDFAPAETEKTIEISILEDNVHESTEEFYVELVTVHGSGIVGLKNLATVVVLDSDSPGELKFETDALNIVAPSQLVRKEIKIKRVGGSQGTVKCAYRTEDDTAKAGRDYEETFGQLAFPKGVMHTFVEVTIFPVKVGDHTKETFRLIIEPCEDEPAVGFDPNTDGGSECGICTITIEADESGGSKQYNASMSAAAMRGWLDPDDVSNGRAKWKEQLRQAVYVGGDPESQADASMMDWVFHVISFPWKVLFAIVPPTDFCGGKLCFVCALFMIGVCTAFIGDLANLLGCALEIPPSICAITFVALGTSLPDTFASKMAAVQDPTADNSIGNVTGSNSVNVFMGLGLSWSIAAIYWELNDGEFRVEAGSLGPSVAVFCGCAGACIALLLVRRWTLGAELGGPVLVARMSSAFLVMLWLVYLVSAVLMVED